ncbi:T7SS effector LXG polymorphic toxin [Bacillus swezeyi]|uniref:Integrase n=1 Tax=Bacillus swezeyi TaxID=1925020 RepID=A0A1R1QPT6_9BACI|nr:T7SS effector LXG polymorphic toxin [Bacillus swezeyi]MEC1261440.1 T7SS effector LXG polymorphic toxin [Bacillus swezeyi]MED2926697.1 T7SS effector LXG polymorphic toxin [Bacillus swezeyi]MED2944170.1 T7SS effector LXG polymorphic toxin [Bacillus swezeyi]MED2965741.1 T7SS effector LXG polymorphic toxin [Bacillus swezeyi]MED3070856.1 T7SS effector LXG polymorphic toxin [Bacillus swezeyi]
MKTLDVQALHNAIDQTLEQLKHQSDEFDKVKKAVESITSLDDALKGKGGDAIRAFYEECHTPFLQFYDTFIEEYSSTLKKMKSALNSLEPNHNGVISQNFLEHELEQGLNAADRTTKHLVSKANATIAKVSHIVDLPELNDSDFHEQNQKALKEINQTIEKLHTFDREQTNSLKTAENDLETMQRYISRLEKMYTGPKIEITGYQKGSILKPDEMDTLRGGQDTAMGVMLDKLDKRSKLEKEVSKTKPVMHTDKLNRLDKLHDNPDEYLNVAKEIGYDNLTSEQMEYVSFLERRQAVMQNPLEVTSEDGKEALQNIGNGIKGSFDALYELGKDIKDGTIQLGWNIGWTIDHLHKDPKVVLDTVLGYDYKGAFQSMVDTLAEKWDEKVVHGDAYSRAHYFTYAIGSLWGLKGGKSSVSTGSKDLAKAGKAAASEAKKAGKTVKQSIKPPNNRYTPALQGILQDAQNSINVKNTPLLKELLEDKKKSVLVQAAPYTYENSSGVTKTINLRMGHLKNKKHPVTGVPYDKDGFPIFESKYTTKLDESDFKKSRDQHFNKLNKELYKEIEANPSIIKKLDLSEDDLLDLRDGITPEKYTWHHHQTPGKMELVDREIHSKTGHTGGYKIWGKDEK